MRRVPRGAGDTRTGLKVLGLVAVLNVPLAWGLCFGVGPLPGLGFVGIALGTGLSHVIGCITLLVILARGKSGLKLHLARTCTRFPADSPACFG